MVRDDLGSLNQHPPTLATCARLTKVRGFMAYIEPGVCSVGCGNKG